MGKDEGGYFMRWYRNVFVVLLGIAVAYNLRNRLLQILFFVPFVRRFIVKRELRKFDLMNHLS